LTVETDDQWQALAALMARDGVVVDPTLGDAAARRARREEVNALVGGWVRDKDGHALAGQLQAAGMASGPVLNNRDLLLDPHLAARGFHERVPLPLPMGPRPMMGRPWKFTERQVRIRHPGPRYGADGEAILREVLGYGELRVARLFAEKVVCTEPTSPKPFDAMGLAELQRLKAIHEVDPDYRRKLGIASP
ncbi:MAG TPA: CoA transferase, partial [Variovorax sp.]